VTDHLARLWLATLERVVSRAAHEVKDALNGVSVNLEVVRSRAADPAAAKGERGVLPFAEAASSQFEVVTGRVEALLHLSRPAPEPADVAVTLRHLAALLVPAARTDGWQLRVTGHERAAPSSAPASAVRLALGSALLAFPGTGSVECRLETGSDTVVRFSHESAGAPSIDPAVASAVAPYAIRTERSDNDLILAFPGYPPSSPNGSTV